MWRESLCIGVDFIDEQHRELFRNIEELLKETHEDSTDHQQNCSSIMSFLRDYFVTHFADEEAYQQSIGYKDFVAHKELHKKFIETILRHEKKMVETGFANKWVKEFIGMLVAWLIYHVSYEDQKIIKEEEQIKALHSHCEIICHSVCDVLSNMAGISAQSIEKPGSPDENFEDTVDIQVTLAGDISGYIVLVYPQTFVKSLIYALMNFTMEEIDELVISAMFETSNIISGAICGRIAEEKGIICDIEPPFRTQRSTILPDERVTLDTQEGIVEVDLAIEYH